MRKTERRNNTNSINYNNNNIANISSGGSRYSCRWAIN